MFCAPLLRSSPSTAAAAGRPQGWLPRSGLLYGTDYVVYPAHPAAAHSTYAVLLCCPGGRGGPGAGASGHVFRSGRGSSYSASKGGHTSNEVTAAGCDGSSGGSSVQAGGCGVHRASADAALAMMCDGGLGPGEPPGGRPAWLDFQITARVVGTVGAAGLGALL